jgi:hypothetical membrane protein
MDVGQYRGVFAWVGIVAIAVTFLGMAGAALFSPSFSVAGNALSNLGDPTDPAGTATTALLFNGGLILGGVGGVVFGVGLFLTAERLLARIGSVVYVVSLALMAGVGLFPQGHGLHFPSASGFYMLFSLAVVVYGVGCLLAGDRRGAVLSVGSGVFNLAGWVVWGVTGSLTRDGLAIPELVGAAAVAGWTLWAASELLVPESSSTTRASPMQFGQ